jgi:hypothetical protein
MYCVNFNSARCPPKCWIGQNTKKLQEEHPDQVKTLVVSRLYGSILCCRDYRSEADET